MNEADEQPLVISGTLCATNDLPPFPARHALAAELAVRIEAASPIPRAGLRERTEAVLRSADQILAWLTTPGPPVRLIGRIGPLTPISEGPTMANPQVPVGYSFAITIEPEDTEGNAVSDQLTWSSSDETDAPVTADSTTLIGTVQVLNPATDTTVTATDGTNTYTYTYDGVVDAPVTLVGTVGVPFKTPAA